MLNNQPIIRLAKIEDVQQLIALCKAHASYEKADYDTLGKNELLVAHLFPNNENIKCIVVEEHNKLLGYSTILKQFSTWDANFYLYVDCLYLKEKARGKGLGRKIMNEIKKYAQQEQCNIQWQTPLFNTNAIKFYESLGAIHKTKERFFWNIL
ncbi:GNAT family N-acetyltransferase [Aquimarina sp. 2201CG14-23]|uniref:GNAT family N-acetyltransferase n=1 Tax=Aquimarina mycalae TaxID=3040073 RepID=UPI0024780DFB|nr:GNAT family N-acetyltransferase [Aquimarina sp. 2201CG14-23]MDH7446431.1 GNAT family N-acetyltransferase [Aquimarina sp. 2201CG14-23]